MSDPQLLAPSQLAPTISVPNTAATTAVARQHLTNTVRSELTKITSLRSAWIVPMIAGGFVALIVALSMLFAKDPSRASVAKSILQVIQIPVIAVAAFVTSTITGEYGHETIRVTYTATPRRGRACTGRYLAALVYSSVAIVAIVLASMAVGTAVLLARGTFYTPSLPLVEVLALIVVVGVLAALGGLSLGYLISRTAAAVTLVSAYIFIEQTLFGALLGTRWEWLVKWFPFSAAWDAALGTENLPGDEFTTLGRPLGLAYFAVIVAVLMALAVGRELRRDT